MKNGVPQLRGNIEFKGHLYGKIATGTVYCDDHSKLTNRELSNQHPIEAITNLPDELEQIDDALDKKLESIPALTNMEIDEILKGAMQNGKVFRR